jgi:hypothetical protein
MAVNRIPHRLREQGMPYLGEVRHISERRVDGDYGPAQGNTVPTPSVNYVAIGGRSYTSNPWDNFFQGRIGSDVAHERSLMASEIAENFDIMKKKYGY